VKKQNFKKVQWGVSGNTAFYEEFKSVQKSPNNLQDLGKKIYDDL
jgi:hypothetical protein